MTRKKTIAGLLQRYNFADFAKTLSLPRVARKDHLRAYIDRRSGGRWSSYGGLRSLTPDIAGVSRGLDPTEPLDFSEIQKGLKARCHRDDLGMNTEAARCLFDFLRPRGGAAYDDHPRQALRIGVDRTISMGIEHYVVEDEQGFFRYLYPRRNPIEGHLPDILMSLIHHNFVQGDFASLGVQIIDLSCDSIIGPRGGVNAGKVRSAKLWTLRDGSLMSRDELNAEANQVYGLLLELADEA